MYRITNNAISVLSFNVTMWSHQCSFFRFMIDMFSLMNMSAQNISKMTPCPRVGIEGNR